MNRQEFKSLLTTKSFIFDRSHYPIIEVSGKEHREWIHRISSQESLSLKEKSVCTTAFLTGGAGVISYFQMLILEDRVWLLIEPQSKEKVLAHLDLSHFGEDISFKEIKSESYFEVVGLPVDINAAYKIKAEDWNRTGAIYIDGEKPELPKMDLGLYQAIKRSQGWPIDQIDINEDKILLEASALTEYATDTKGCYPGQEVIAKIITYGRVAKKIVALFSKDKVDNGAEISYGAGKAGTVVATYALSDGYLVLAYVLRVAHDSFLQEKDNLKINDSKLSPF